MTTFREQLFTGKVAVVTGGGSGINQVIAEQLAAQGARVVVIGRTQSKLDTVAHGIVARGGEAAGYSADVRDSNALVTVMTTVRERFGRIDMLVCGAAGNFPAPASKMSANAFKSVVDIDLLGTFNTCRAAYDHLTIPGASIVMISAPQAFQALPLQSHVSAAKAGVDMLMRSLAVEWGGAGIRVNAVSPGAVAETEGMDRLAPAGPMRDALAKRLPLGRLGTKSDIADIVTFLCSDAASYVTGSVLVCDGGLLASGAMYGLARGE